MGQLELRLGKTLCLQVSSDDSCREKTQAKVRLVQQAEWKAGTHSRSLQGKYSRSVSTREVASVTICQ